MKMHRRAMMAQLLAAPAVSGAGLDARWSDAEMHDAMLVFWSRFSATAQWAMWVFFAGLNEEDGKSLGGIMFDDIGAQHRQGTAIFNKSFIADPPARACTSGSRCRAT